MSEMNIRCPWVGWQIVRTLGSGSFGAVYEIHRILLDGSTEKAAMKVIAMPKNSAEAQSLLNTYGLKAVNEAYLEALKDIVKEYSLMSKLKGNGNIVHCEDLHHEPKADGIGYNLFIKMELLTPVDRVLGKDVNEAQVIKLGMDICNALVSCKKHNIIHRDIKPANIMISEDGMYKLGDFGIAKSSDRTSNGTVAGTLSFMAPEVYGNRPYGAAVDIYSLGMVMYILLNENVGPFLPLPPVLPKSSEMENARRRRFNGEALPAPKHGSPALQRIVLKACASEPADRYASAEEMLTALRALSDTAGGKLGRSSHAKLADADNGNIADRTDMFRPMESASRGEQKMRIDNWFEDTVEPSFAFHEPTPVPFDTRLDLKNAAKPGDMARHAGSEWAGVGLSWAKLVGEDTAEPGAVLREPTSEGHMLWQNPIDAAAGPGAAAQQPDPAGNDAGVVARLKRKSEYMKRTLQRNEARARETGSSTDKWSVAFWRRYVRNLENGIDKYDFATATLIDREEQERGCTRTIRVGGRNVTVAVPAGTENNTILKYSDQGQKNDENGTYGALYLFVAYKDAPAGFFAKGIVPQSAGTFVDEGPFDHREIVMVSLQERKIGFTREVYNGDEDFVTIVVPGDATADGFPQTLTFEGAGKPNAVADGRGDLHVLVSVF